MFNVSIREYTRSALTFETGAKDCLVHWKVVPAVDPMWRRVRESGSDESSTNGTPYLPGAFGARKGPKVEA